MPTVDTALYIGIAAISLILAALGGHFSSKIPAHKWWFWLLGLVGAVLVVFSGFRNQHTQAQQNCVTKDMKKQLTDLQQHANRLQETIATYGPKLDAIMKNPASAEQQRAAQNLANQLQLQIGVIGGSNSQNATTVYGGQHQVNH